MKRVVWAANPLGDEKGYFQKSLKAVEKLAAANDWEVEPVIVMAPTKVFYPKGADTALISQNMPKAEDAWAKLTKTVKQKSRFLQPTVLRSDSPSQRGQAKELVEHATGSGAETVLVATRGRKGAARAFLGSFAETLLHQATLPVLVFNPMHEMKPKIKNVFCPVDLPQSASGPFSHVVELAKHTGAKLTLYHKIDYVTEYTSHLVLQVPMYEGYLSHDVQERKAELSKLEASVRSAGVKVEGLLDQKPGYVADRALSVSKKLSADLIALFHKSGPIASHLLGSVTLSILRGAKCPVWVVRG